MSDEFETLLREHFRQASERIDPGPELLQRARAAGRRRRVHAWSPRLNAVAAGAAGLMVVGGLVVGVAVLPRSLAGNRTDPASRPPEPVTLHAASVVVPAGGRIRLTGTAYGRIEIFLRIGGSWTGVGDATPAYGRYSATVVAREGAGAVRACLAVSTVCSATVRLRIASSPTRLPAPTPTRTQGSSPGASAPPPVRSHPPTPTPSSVGSSPAPPTPIPTSSTRRP